MGRSLRSGDSNNSEDHTLASVVSVRNLPLATANPNWSAASLRRCILGNSLRVADLYLPRNKAVQVLRGQFLRGILQLCVLGRSLHTGVLLVAPVSRPSPTTDCPSDRYAAQQRQQEIEAAHHFIFPREWSSDRDGRSQTFGGTPSAVLHRSPDLSTNASAAVV
eukprot:gene19503-23321_t